MTRARPKPAYDLCGAMTRAGTPCKRKAGAGTSHPGDGHCANHGGSTPSGEVHGAREAGRRIAGELALLAGGGVSIDPGVALLTCVHMAWAEVQFFSDQVAKLELDAAVVRPKRETTASLGENMGYEVEDLQQQEQLNLWIRERQAAMERLAKYSKLALDAGVAQQQVDLARMQGRAIAPTLRAMFEDLDLSAKQMKLVPGVLRKHLTALVAPSPVAQLER